MRAQDELLTGQLLYNTGCQNGNDVNSLIPAGISRYQLQNNLNRYSVPAILKAGKLES